MYTYELIKQPITSIVKMGSPIDGEATGDESGRVLTLNSDGTILAIAANSNDGNGSGSGHVRVYQYTDNNWIQLGSDIDGESQGDHSGAGVSLSADGTILAISAYYNAGNGYMSGHVRIYQYTDNNWQQLGSDIDGETGDRSGYSVSLSSDGTIVAISEPHNDANGSDSGRVRVYQYTDNNWIQLGSDIGGDDVNDRTGYMISLSSDGTILAISTPWNQADRPYSGHVRVYQYIDNNWQQLGSDIYGEAQDDQSGMSISLSSDGTIVAIGAIYNAGKYGLHTGHARVYQYTDNNWIQLGSDIDGEAQSDHSGYSVSLSADGTILAIGTPYNDTNGSNSDSGHVRIYQYVKGSYTHDWIQLGSDIDGEAKNDWFGFWISLNDSGNILAVGARLHDSNGGDSGRCVYI